MNKKGFSHESQKNKTVEWYTPPWIFKELNIQFDLDPCHAIKTIDWIPVKKTYNIEDDGLTREWYADENIWLNPPYGKHTKQWLEKLCEQGNGIALVFARTDCKWFHEICTKSDAILFLKGRIKFVDGMGETGGSGPGAGSMLVAWGDSNADALKRMSHLGFYVKQ